MNGLTRANRVVFGLRLLDVDVVDRNDAVTVMVLVTAMTAMTVVVRVA